MDDKQRMDDAAFADAILKGQPAAAVPAALQARILADFDRVAARRASGLAHRIAQHWSERLWPGVPVWQPVSVLALSLIVGLTAGAFVPAFTTSGVSSDQIVAALDTTTTDADLDKDL